jgi:PPE-repeat protein
MPPKSPLLAEGYGQLSISGTLLTVKGYRTSAGVWGLIGPAAVVDPLKTQGPSTTAAVVAYSTGAPIDAVYAESMLHAGVTAVGHTENVPAIQATHDGTTGGATAMQGTSTAGRGVAGFSTTWQGVYGHSNSNAGVVGESDNFDGVFGISHNASAAGVSGHNPGGLAGYFEGDVTVTGDLSLTGADFAEQFDLSTGSESELETLPGTVMIVDDNGTLSPCSHPYDRRAVGVVSGAGEYKAAIVLDKQAGGRRVAIALLGKTLCRVNADLGAIEIGDLITTSTMVGHAMKASDPARAFGCVIGKALRPLARGMGMIPILVAMQ